MTHDDDIDGDWDDDLWDGDEDWYCDLCGGTGECQMCDGDGCEDCQQSGLCNECDGEGEV